MKSAQPDFVAKRLKVGAFPAVTGGKGDPKNLAGNPANYWSLSAKASAAEQDIAKAQSVTSRLYCLQEGRVSLEGASSQITREAIARAYFGV